MCASLAETWTFRTCVELMWSCTVCTSTQVHYTQYIVFSLKEGDSHTDSGSSVDHHEKVPPPAQLNVFSNVIVVGLSVPSKLHNVWVHRTSDMCGQDQLSSFICP